MLSALLVVWLGMAGPIDIEKIKNWQTLIGACVTGAGVLVAARNVTRQMRLTARAQEYSRIERDLPGMRSALHLVFRIARIVKDTADPSKVLAELENVNIKTTGPDITKDVELALPNDRDLYFEARGPISAHITAASKADRIVENIEPQADVKGGAP